MEQLFWKKHKPLTIDDIILLPRVRKTIESGIKNNMIFHGGYGMGKTALSNILIETHPNIKFNASLHTSIDNLRNGVDDFCSNLSMFDKPNDMKVVFLDEIERTSSSYQDALKGFIEEYERNVRFVATTNHIQKVQPGVLSRFLSINFNPQNKKEEQYLKEEYAKRLKVISEEEEVNISNKDIVSIINSNFPDMRQMVTIIQHIKETGEIKFNSSSYQTEAKDELFKHIMDNGGLLSNYNFIMSTFGEENIIDMINLLGRPFIEYAISADTKLLNKMDGVVDVVTDYNNMYPNSIDPIVLGISLLGKVQKIIHS